MKSIILIFLSLLIVGSTLSADELISIQNEFIKIVVNNKDAKGRFALQTTQGDPSHDRDDNKDLIYGQPVPWTSYSTIMIDGKPFVFGDSDKRLARRSQKEFSYLPIQSQSIQDNSIISKATYADIEIVQTLSFYRNPNTLINDSMKISYAIHNYSESEHDLGLRILLDTKLGENDAAPLRMGEDTVPTEIKYDQSELLPYWQTFDSLTSPNVVAQGLLRDFNQQLTMPDRIYLANWGTLVDSEWDIQYEKGRSFIRKGEKEKDTALALYYQPTIISPNMSVTMNTVFGLGGLSFTLGELSTGLTAPKQVPGASREPFLVVGYLLNSSGFDALNTVAEFELPSSLTIVKGQRVTSFNRLAAGSQRQIPLLVVSNTEQPQKAALSFSVNSSTFEKNSIKRYINILGKPVLDIQSFSLRDLGARGQHYVLDARIKNPSPLAIDNLSLILEADSDLVFPLFDSAQKNIPYLAAYQSQDLSWAFKATDAKSLESLLIEMNSDLSGKVRQRFSLDSSIINRSYLEALGQDDANLGYYALQLTLPDKGAAFTLDFDSTQFSYLRASHLDTVQVDVSENRVSIQHNNDDSGRDRRLILHFKREAFGDSPFVLRQDEKALQTLVL